MANLLATGAALLAVALFAIALLGMAAGDLRMAGLSFLSTALVIYLRETRLLDS